MITSSESVIDYEVVIFVLSKDAMQDAIVTKSLKEASDLNKLFLPVILGGNLFSNWLLKKSYKGPDLRTSILSLRKDEDMRTFMQQIASYGGSKILGDVYGAKVEFDVDLDCNILRDNSIIAEGVSTTNLHITLYKGIHKLVFQSKKYPDLTTEIKVKVKHISTSMCLNVKIAKHRNVEKRAFANGYYEGSLYLDSRDGYGTFWFPNGDFYQGNWDNDIISGKGTMVYSNGAKYEGNWSNGKRHGYGKIIWSPNDYYEGEFSNDLMSGKGKKYYNDGSYYDGSWSNGKYHGKGTLRYADGSKYVGDWVVGVQHGHGIEYDSSGDKVFEGEWKNGQKQTFFNRIKNWWNSI